MKKHITKLIQKYPSSTPCTCDTCIRYCLRPGWWTVEECKVLLSIGMANRMMLEFSPDFSFGVLSPAFKKNEGLPAIQEFSGNGCTFLINQRCELFNSRLQPLECRFCHHERKGQGFACHHDLERDWNSSAGKRLVSNWVKMMKLGSDATKIV